MDVVVRCCEGKKSGSALLCVCSLVLITSKGVMRNEVVTAPVTAATAFLLRETGFRGAPWPKLERRLAGCGRSSEVIDMDGKASRSSTSARLDDDDALSKVVSMPSKSSRYLAKC